MKQGWYDLVYVHFDYSPEVVQNLLPDGLLVDTFDDKAWIGLIPFSMRGIGIPRLPSVPYLGSFPEVNVRTYVTRNGVPGVWFFSLDINRMLPTFVARTTYKLPYCFGAVSHMRESDDVYTTVRRRWPKRNANSTSARTSLRDTDRFRCFCERTMGFVLACGTQHFALCPSRTSNVAVTTSKCCVIRRFIGDSCGVTSTN